MKIIFRRETLMSFDGEREIKSFIETEILRSRSLLVSNKTDSGERFSWREKRDMK